MTDSIRCPACRGAKKVPKLGGMIGECNTCTGKGTILASEKPVVSVVAPQEIDFEVIKAVAQALPVSDVNIEAEQKELAHKFIESGKREVLPEEPQIKVDGKRAVFKRKTASKQ